MKLKEHLHKSRLTSNAAVLLVWITLSAHQGRLEASYEDLMRGLGWSRKMLQRTIADLTQRGYIRVTRATSQRSKMLIEVLIDFEESSGVDKAVHHNAKESPVPDKDVHAGKSGVDKAVHDYAATADVDKDVHGIEGSVPDVPSGATDSTPKALEIPAKYLAGELSNLARKTLAYVSFDVDPRSLTKGFVVALEKFGRRQPLPSPGRLGTQIIDACLLTQRKRAARGEDPGFFRFPPGFQRHRDALRKKERAAGKSERQARAVA